MISERSSDFGFFMKVLLLWHLHLKLVCGLNCLYDCVERKDKKTKTNHHCKKEKRLKNCYYVRKKMFAVWDKGKGRLYPPFGIKAGRSFNEP